MPKETVVDVPLGERHYPLIIGPEVLKNSTALAHINNPNQILVVTNKTIAPLYLAKLCKYLGIDANSHVIILPDGEAYKSWSSIESIIERLLDLHFDRSATLIGLGGGVIGDTTGFAAAIYQRGIDFINVPTSLLAQVDAAVGGKTAINHPKVKNLIGAFHQPKCVLIDPNTLETLSPRHFNEGLAEVVKHALIADADFFALLEEQADVIMARDAEILQKIITRCCEIKADIVAEDEREQSGHRALLNLGHTLGHALESTLGYGQLYHGEAVAIGLIQALYWSEQCVALDPEVRQRTEKLLKAFKLPTIRPMNSDKNALLTTMAHDKKTLNSQQRVVLLKSLGQASIHPCALDELSIMDNNKNNPLNGH